LSVIGNVQSPTPFQISKAGIVPTRSATAYGDVRRAPAFIHPSEPEDDEPDEGNHDVPEESNGVSLTAA
jgi:hypothetical protein